MLENRWMERSLNS